MSHNTETQTQSLLSRYYKWRGAAATATAQIWRSTFPRFMIFVFVPSKRKEKIGQNYTTNKNAHIASVTRLMKNDCLLFYSLGSCFCESWWITYPTDLCQRFVCAKVPGQTTSIRNKRMNEEQFTSITLEIDAKLAHLKCRTCSLIAPSSAVVCCKYPGC